MSDAISTNRTLTIMKTKLIVAALSFALMCVLTGNAQSPAPSSGKKPNILVIFGDDIGQTNISAYSGSCAPLGLYFCAFRTREGINLKEGSAPELETHGRRRVVPRASWKPRVAHVLISAEAFGGFCHPRES